MAEKITLRAESGRPTGSRASRRLRRDGAVPGIVYGRHREPLTVTVDHHDLMVALSTEAGSNALITLEVGGEELLTLPKQVERHPFRNRIRHIDFLAVSLTEKVRADVNVHLVGEPEGAREGGVLSQSMSSVAIESLPTDIPPGIEVDVSALGVGDSIRVADLPEFEGVTYFEDPDAVVASVTIPRAVVEEEPEEEELEEGAEEAAEEGAEEAASEPSDEDSGSE